MVNTSAHTPGWIHELTIARSWTFGRRAPARSLVQLRLPAEKAKRRHPDPQDKTLSSIVPRWLESSPAIARPNHLCAEFPRIVNRIALCWPDATLTVGLLNQFFIDKRGGRGLRRLAVRRMNRLARG